MKLKLTRLAMALAPALFGAALAAPASAMTLMQAYEAAMANDPSFRIAVQESNSGKEYAVLGRSNLLPQLSASYSANKIHADLTQPDPFVPSGFRTTHPVYYSRSAALQLRQPVFNLDAWARYKQGAAQTKYSDALFDARVQEMLLRVTGAYVDALFAGEQVALTQAQRDTYQEQMNVNARLFEKGEGTKTDMLETQARLDLSEAQLLEAQDAQQSARTALSALVGGVDVGALDQLKDYFRIAPLPEGGVDGLKQSALDSNPEIQAQIFAIEAARQEVNKARAGHAPRLDLVASYVRSNADTLNTYTQESTSRAVGVQLNVPLYSGGAVSAQYRQAVAGLEKAKAELQLRTDKVVVDLRKNYAAVVSSATRIRALDKAVASAQQLIVATEQSIKGGVRINLDLLNAKQQLYSSQKELAQARYTYLLNILRVKGAAGTLGPDDVREMASYFK